MRRRTSILWRIEKEELKNIVKNCNSISKILQHFELAVASGNYKTLKARLEYDNIDYSHIKLGKYCNLGKNFNREKIPLEEITVKHSNYNRGNLKKRLLEKDLIENKCSICGQEGEWNGKKLVMVLDHINGVRDDHRLENLRMLCPNCNSQQKTFAGRNNRKKLYFCEKCGKKITKNSKSNKCHYCSCKNTAYKKKVENRPSYKQLLKEIEETNYCSVGRKYGVSDNCIRKWIKYYEKQ